MESLASRVIDFGTQTDQERRLDELIAMCRETGGDPSRILEKIATIVKNQDWRSLPDPRGGSESFLGYFRRIGWSRDDLESFVRHARHRHEKPTSLNPDVKARMEEMRAKVLDLVNPAALFRGGQEGNGNALKLVEHETPCEPKNEPDNVRFVSEGKPEKDYGNSASYFVSRLKRDRPDLAERVISGEVSANSAMIQAGFRVKSITVPIDSVRAVGILAKHFDNNSLLEITRGLAHILGLNLMEIVHD